MKIHITLILIGILFSSCMDDTIPIQRVDLYGSRGIFIVNEGNYLYGNSSLSYYDIDTRVVINDIFTLANGIPIGDVANSLEIRDGKGYIVVNNSGCILIIDLNSVVLTGTITGLTSPRYLLFLSDQKALVSDMYSRGITIINPEKMTITGRISTGSKSMPYYRHPSENLIRIGDEVFSNCWSYDNKILVIDIPTSNVVDSIDVGVQPYSMVADKYAKIWIICDGGYPGNPAGYEKPSLVRMNPLTHSVEKRFWLPDDVLVGKLALNPEGDTLYFISNDVYRMNVNSSLLPDVPFIRRDQRIFRTVATDYKLGDIYIADVADYMSEGRVFRYNTQGEPVDTFQVGIIPSHFSFN